VKFVVAEPDDPELDDATFVVADGSLFAEARAWGVYTVRPFVVVGPLELEAGEAV